MKNTLILLALLLSCIASRLTAADLLVVMNGSGRVERYDAGGKHLGTFISGLLNPNGLVFGPDGSLYISTGSINWPGTVRRHDGRTGNFLGHFVPSKPADQRGALVRATSLAWHDGDLFVVSCDDGKVRRFDGQADAMWAGPREDLKTPLRLEFGPDGNLYCAAYDANTVTVWNPDGKLLRTVGGSAMKNPIGVAFASQPMPERRVAVLGGTNAPSQPVVRVEAMLEEGQVSFLSWDTEGGDRSKLNLLRSGISLSARSRNGLVDLACQGSRQGRDTVVFRLSGAEVEITWTLLAGRVEGSRTGKSLTVTFELPVPRPRSTIDLEFSPVVLPAPDGYRDEKRWAAARRGWFNLIQQSCGASGGDANVHGVWANNALSDPVSSVLYMLGDATILVPELADGVTMAPILRRAVDYWIDCKTDPDGLVAYTAGGEGQNVMDANPAVLIGAWCYVKVSSDKEWLQRRIERLEFLSRYMEKRDVDADGLIESKQSGNSGSRPPRDPDSAWDCYNSGHKNAYVNTLAYRAWLGLADLERQLGQREQEQRYRDLARRLRAAFLNAFFNPETGWLGFWRSQDGKLHDLHMDAPTSLAISYVVGMTQRADMILDAMLKRQKDGVFPNGGGFQNGFVDQMGGGAEVFDWSGKPTGYEGHLVYCWAFLHSMLRKEPALFDRVLPPAE